MSRLLEKILYGLIGLVFLIWVGYHIFDRYYQPMETETVYEYTMAQTLTARGVAIREETVIDQIVSGIENTLFEDGERTRAGQTVAEFYESAGSDRGVKRMREIAAEIEKLRQDQDQNINNYANTDNLNRDIRDQLGQLATMASVSGFVDSQNLRGDLTSLLNRRQIATGKEEDFAARIGELEAEYARLSSSTSGSGMVAATAPVSGYFVKTVDGYEPYLNPGILETYSIADFSRVIRSAVESPAQSYAGKIVTDHNWRFAVVVKKENIEAMQVGQKVDLAFSTIPRQIPATIEQIVEEDDNGDAVVVFHCDQVSSETINLRIEDVSIHFVEYTGLRIAAASLHFKDGIMGVYVVEENVVRFKNVELVYEEAGFVLARTNIIDTPDYRVDDVRLYHQVITKGTDLYDNKPLG
jgi:putative membrane fusion protein